VSFLELEKRKLFSNIMLNTKRRREGEDILERGGEEKRMSLIMREGKREEKERWRFGRRRKEVVEEKGRRSWEKWRKKKNKWGKERGELFDRL